MEPFLEKSTYMLGWLFVIFVGAIAIIKMAQRCGIMPPDEHPLRAKSIARKGYTLVELLVAMTVIAILFAITVAACHSLVNSVKRDITERRLQIIANRYAHAVANVESQRFRKPVVVHYAWQRWVDQLSPGEYRELRITLQFPKDYGYYRGMTANEKYIGVYDKGARLVIHRFRSYYYCASKNPPRFSGFTYHQLESWRQRYNITPTNKHAGSGNRSAEGLWATLNVGHPEFSIDLAKDDTDGDGLWEYVDAWGRPIDVTWRWDGRHLCPTIHSHPLSGNLDAKPKF